MSMNNFGAGMITGIIIGSALNKAMKDFHPKKSAAKIKKNMGRTIKTVGNIIDSF